MQPRVQLLTLFNELLIIMLANGPLFEIYWLVLPLYCY